MADGQPQVTCPSTGGQGEQTWLRDEEPRIDIVELSSFEQAKLHCNRHQRAHPWRPADLANAVLTTAVEAWG